MVKNVLSHPLHCNVLDNIIIDWGKISRQLGKSSFGSPLHYATTYNEKDFIPQKHAVKESGSPSMHLHKLFQQQYEEYRSGKNKSPLIVS